MNAEGHIRLEWDGKTEAVARVGLPIPLTASLLHSVGRKNSGNMAVLGDGIDSIGLVEGINGLTEVNFAYVNLQNAVSGKKTDAEWLSAAVQILMRIDSLLAKNAIAVVRPTKPFICRIAVLMDEIFQTRLVKQVSVMRGYDGFTELLAACPDSAAFPVSGWRWWRGMIEQCCPSKGTSLFVGLDEAAAEFIRRIEADGSRTKAAMVFPLESVERRSSNFRQNAFDAWNAVQDEASRQPECFCGIDVYETKFNFDAPNNPQNGVC